MIGSGLFFNNMSKRALYLGSIHSKLSDSGKVLVSFQG